VRQAALVTNSELAHLVLARGRAEVSSAERRLEKAEG